MPMDANDFPPKVLDQLVVRWQAMSARRASGVAGRCNCGCKCAASVAANERNQRPAKNVGVVLAAEPAASVPVR